MDDVDNGAYERRREQVRKAQKSHRARKATYVKSLEEEVAKLREREAVHIQEAKANQYIIRRLQEALTSNGVPIPADCSEAKPFEPVATIQVTGRSFPNQSIEASLLSTNISMYDDYRAQISHDMTKSPGSGTIGSSPNSGTESSGTQPSNRRSRSVERYAHPQGLDATQVGVNFVLALEQPCLNHHKLPSAEMLITGSIGNGHRAMLSTPIMARSPSFSMNPFHMGYSAGARWNVPGAELEALLRLSQDLELGEEVTPVQIWQVLRQHQKFSALSFEQLDHLRQTLSPLVKCYGFGAVIDRSAFEKVMVESLSSL